MMWWPPSRRPVLRAPLLLLLLVSLLLWDASAESWLSFQGLTSPVAVALDSAGRLYVSLQSSFQVLTLSGSAPYSQLSSLSVSSFALAVNGEGDIYTVDTAAGSVSVLQHSAADGSIIGNYTAGSELGQVGAVAVDGQGNVWSATVLSQVCMFSPDGELRFTVGAAGRPYSLTAIAVNASGVAYWLDEASQIIRAISSGGAEIGNWSYAALGPQFGFTSLAVTDDGLAYLARPYSNELLLLSLGQDSPEAVPLSFNTTGAGLSYPYSVALQAGTLWVADYGNNRLVQLASDGTLLAVAQSPYPALISPASVDLDPLSGDIVVLSTTSDVVTRVASTGALQGSQLSTFRIPYNYMNGRLALDNAGRAYVTDVYTHPFSVEQVDIASGQLLQQDTIQLGEPTLGGLAWAADALLLAVPGYGALRFTNASQDALQLSSLGNASNDVVGTAQGDVLVLVSDVSAVVAVNFTLNSSEPLQLPVRLSDAQGLALDSSNNLLIADTGNNRVIWVSSSGQLLQELTTSRPALRGPQDLVVDAAGNCWVADTGNNRLVLFPLIPPASSSSSTAQQSSSSGPSSASAPPVPSSPLNATLLSASVTAFVASAFLSVPVQLTFQSPQNVLLILLAAAANVTADDLDQALLTPPTVDLNDWSGSLQQFQQWAAALSLSIVYTATNVDTLSPAATVGQLGVSFPAMSALGYHRLLVLSPSQLTDLLDWVLVLPLVCTTLLTAAGTCSSPCPTGGFCLGDGRVWPVPGYWSVSEHTAPASCAIASICPGALQAQPGSDSPDPVLNADGSRDTQRCELGYTGPYCADCAVDYYHSSQACRYCGSADRGLLAGLVLVAIVIVSILSGLLLLSPPSALHTQIGVILAVQQAVTIGQTAGASLPARLAWLQAVFNSVAIVNLNIAMFQPGCLIAQLSLLSVFWASLAVVLGAAALFTLAAAGRATALLHLIKHGRLLWLRAPLDVTAPSTAVAAGLPACSGSALSPASNGESATDDLLKRMRRILAFSPATRADVAVAYELGRRAVPSWWSLFRSRWQHSLVILGALCYLRLTTASLQMFRCVSVPVPDLQSGVGSSLQSLLAADRVTRCFQGQHVPGFVVAVLIVLLFSLGFPVAVALYIRSLWSTAHLAQRLGQLQVWMAKVKHAAAAPSSSPSNSPSAASSGSDDGLSLKALLSSAFTLQRGSSQTPDRAVRDASSPTPDSPSLAGLSSPSEKDPQLQLVEQVVLDRLSSHELTARDAAHLQAAYLLSAEEMLLLERQANCGYLLSELRAQQDWRVQYFPVALLALSFVFCCAVAFPDSVALTLLLCGLTFVAQGAVVAFFLPYVSSWSNGTAVLGAVVKLLQCLIALGLLQAVSLTSISPDPAAAHSDSAQQLLASTTFRFFQQNLAFVATLCCLLLVPAALYAAGRWYQAQQLSSQQAKLRRQLQDETDYSVTHASPAYDDPAGEDAYTATGPSAATAPPHYNQVEMIGRPEAQDASRYAERSQPVAAAAATDAPYASYRMQPQVERRAVELTAAPPLLPVPRAHFADMVLPVARAVAPPLPPRRRHPEPSVDPYANNTA